MKKNFIDSSTIIGFLTRKLSLSMLMLVALASPSFGQVKLAEIVEKPTVNDDRVTIRIKVKNAEERPVMGLQETDFKLLVDKKPVELKNKDWKSPEEITPAPAWIIVMLDFSGSMNELDSRGTKKIAGAIKAVRQLTSVLKNTVEKIPKSPLFLLAKLALNVLKDILLIKIFLINSLQPMILSCKIILIT